MNLKKMLAPIIVTICVCLYYAIFIAICLMIDGIPFIVKIIGCAIPAAIMLACIYVLVERIKEIRSGEEDDLSKY